MTTAHFNMARFARIACLSVIYLVLILLIGSQINGWLSAHLSPSPANAPTIDNLKRSWLPFAFPNALVFAVSLLWLSRTRNFAPLARYLVPTLFAVVITYILLLPIIALETLITLSASAAGRITLIDVSHFGIPGLIAAQLFRLPRTRSDIVPYGGPATQAS